MTYRTSSAAWIAAPAGSRLAPRYLPGQRFYCHCHSPPRLFRLADKCEPTMYPLIMTYLTIAEMLVFTHDPRARSGDHHRWPCHPASYHRDLGESRAGPGGPRCDPLIRPHGSPAENASDTVKSIPHDITKDTRHDNQQKRRLGRNRDRLTSRLRADVRRDHRTQPQGRRLSLSHRESRGGGKSRRRVCR